ncbi:NADPH-dependent F420 reductase [Devosia marina]|uniref:Oxidoreductase n=1 Tax=Devosia marina TaxID=2683198 RepID=A0A7X3FQN2_9HYPH|nr:NAD(P)-binding domain-containing protein [Devosia marina]MVS98997.1 oxidoreductase [Devosia marina]
MTKIAIIGLGNMGKGLARRLDGKVALFLGTRDIDSGQSFAVGFSQVPQVLSRQDAAAAADLVVLALPYASAIEFVRSTNLDGKVVVDLTNPLKEDFSGLLIGHSTSAAEEIQALALGARVVKAYNTIFASLFDRPASDTAATPVFLAGDDEAALASVTRLVEISGFSAEPTGGLGASRLVEPLGMLNIQLGYHQGRGTAIAPAWQAL